MCQIIQVDQYNTSKSFEKESHTEDVGTEIMGIVVSGEIVPFLN